MGAQSCFTIVAVIIAALTIQPNIAESNSSTGRSPRLYISGGSEATPHSWPWIVYLDINTGRDFIDCGGSIISNQWVVTAAHCLFDENQERVSKEDVRITAGAHDVSKQFEPSRTVYGVAEIKVHEKFDNYNPHDDIALLKVDGKIKFSDEVSAIPLPTKEADEYTECKIAGWGDFSNVDYPVTVLREAPTNILEPSECDLLGEDFDPDIMLCAGNDAYPIQNSCWGDSGGPLVCNQDRKYYLQGIISWGPPMCPKRRAARVRVLAYNEWIEDKTGKISAASIFGNISGIIIGLLVFTISYVYKY